ncbi:MAG: hypothetical protein R2882_13365 [Gemmatimonadales bacterium]
MLTEGRHRYYPSLDELAPLWNVPGISWVNLQYDDCETELNRALERHGVRIHRWADEDLRNDLESVIALLGSIDAVVVTAPTAVSFSLAAAGRAQMDSGSDWTTLGDDRSPWFPAIKLMRRAPTDGSWGPMAHRLADELQAWSGR